MQHTHWYYGQLNIYLNMGVTPFGRRGGNKFPVLTLETQNSFPTEISGTTRQQFSVGNPIYIGKPNIS